MESLQLKEILTKTLANFKTSSITNQLGICQTLFGLYYTHQYLTYNEYREVSAYLHENKPTKDNQYSEFTENEYWRPISNFWWSTVKDKPNTKEIRIDYLTKLIANIK